MAEMDNPTSIKSNIDIVPDSTVAVTRSNHDQSHTDFESKTKTEPLYITHRQLLKKLLKVLDTATVFCCIT